MSDEYERQGTPDDEDVLVSRLEIEFALPTYLPPGFLRELDSLLSSAVRMKMNQPVGGVHWVSGYGSKPLWSKADARLLGKTPADDAPAVGEPRWDGSVYHIETTARPLSERELEKQSSNARPPSTRSESKSISPPTSQSACTIINIDGGSRGNPGPGGAGIYITHPNGKHTEIKVAFPHLTNNAAEYRALIAALCWALDNSLQTVRILSDSELLVKQMRGEYKVKSPELYHLFTAAKQLANQIETVTFEHIRREFNKDADRLANEAMDDAARNV
jgi:ribonuclease HI